VEGDRLSEVVTRTHRCLTCSLPITRGQPETEVAARGSYAVRFHHARMEDCETATRLADHGVYPGGQGVSHGMVVS
jgi:hypothetical protein